MSPVLYAALLLAGVFINSVSQMMLKKAALKTYPSRLKEYLNVRVVSAYAISTLVTMLYSYAYKGIPLSLGPVLEAAGYIFVTMWGVSVFGEKLNAKKVFALTLIVLGIAVSAVWG